MNRYPQGWPVGYVEKIPAAGREHAIIRQRRVETALHSETTPATQLAKTQEDVLSPNESQAIRGRLSKFGRAARTESLPAPKNFLQKRLSHKGYPPLCGQNHFWASFW